MIQFSLANFSKKPKFYHKVAAGVSFALQDLGWLTFNKMERRDGERKKAFLFNHLANAFEFIELLPVALFICGGCVCEGW